MVYTRIAGMEDLPALRRLAISTYTDTFGEYYTPGELSQYLVETYSAEKLQAEFNEPGAVLYLAFDDDDKMIGFLRLRSNRWADEFPGTNQVELHQLYVHSSYRGAGVAKALVEEAIQYASKHGYHHIWLSVWENNFRAQKFYAKCGFLSFRKYSYMVGNEPQVDLLMSRNL